MRLTLLINRICRATSQVSATVAQLLVGSLVDTLYTSALIILPSEASFSKAVKSILYQPSLTISMYSEGDESSGCRGTIISDNYK